MTHFSDGETISATILRFPQRRGRPRKALPRHDTGTPELVMKRLQNLTIEPIDLCLERNIITPAQHRCGIHLRWLYTIRYGVPNVRAIDPAHFGGMELKEDDPAWRAAREQEFAEAVCLLRKRKVVALVMDVCVYNDRPDFLHPTLLFSPKKAQKINRQILTLNEGLTILVDLWQR